MTAATTTASGARAPQGARPDEYERLRRAYKVPLDRHAFAGPLMERFGRAAGRDAAELLEYVLDWNRPRSSARADGDRRRFRGPALELHPECVRARLHLSEGSYKRARGALASAGLVTFTRSLGFSYAAVGWQAVERMLPAAAERDGAIRELEEAAHRAAAGLAPRAGGVEKSGAGGALGSFSDRADGPNLNRAGEADGSKMTRTGGSDGSNLNRASGSDGSNLNRAQYGMSPLGSSRPKSLSSSATSPVAEGSHGEGQGQGREEGRYAQGKGRAASPEVRPEALAEGKHDSPAEAKAAASPSALSEGKQAKPEAPNEGKADTLTGAKAAPGPDATKQAKLPPQLTAKSPEVRKLTDRLVELGKSCKRPCEGKWLAQSYGQVARALSKGYSAQEIESAWKHYVNQYRSDASTLGHWLAGTDLKDKARDYGADSLEAIVNAARAKAEAEAIAEEALRGVLPESAKVQRASAGSDRLDIIRIHGFDPLIIDGGVVPPDASPEARRACAAEWFATVGAAQLRRAA